jgi:[acyl-carrier-protein] S-malonyltransferase
LTLNPQETALLFPGQGSQFVGMGAELAQRYPAAQQVFAQADALLGFSISRLAWNGPEKDLNETINTQPALMVHSIAALRVLQELHPDFKPVMTAGHSMGELSALVAAGAMTFEIGLPLVRTRGEAMRRAGEISPGGMAAILGLDIPTLDEICTTASQPGQPVQVANDNCPGQVVISGAAPSLERALELAKAAGAKRAVPLAVSIAAHSELMRPAQEQFTQAVQEAAISAPGTPTVGNVSATPLKTAEQVRADLYAQLTSRVRWTESIQWMIAQGITTFIEVGSSSVLSGLLRRINRSVQALPLGSPEDFERLAAAF